MERAKKKKRGAPAKPILEHPTPLCAIDVDPSDFAQALADQIKRHGDSISHLWKALAHFGHVIDEKAIRA